MDYELGGATDEEEAELEEQEALVLQQRMAAELDEGDFELGPLLGAEGEEKRTEKVMFVLHISLGISGDVIIVCAFFDSGDRGESNPGSVEAL